MCVIVKMSSALKLKLEFKLEVLFKLLTEPFNPDLTFGISLYTLKS